jgi:hypothetical protein
MERFYLWLATTSVKPAICSLKGGPGFFGHRFNQCKEFPTKQLMDETYQEEITARIDYYCS